MRDFTYFRWWQEQNSRMWLLLAAVWAAGGLAGWLAATLPSWPGVSWPAEAIRGDTLTLLSLIVVAISAGLRIPLFSKQPTNAAASDHLLWFLGCLASANWLGFVLLRSAGWREALPPVLLITGAEIWFLSRGLRGDRLPWLKQISGELTMSTRASWIGTAIQFLEPQPSSRSLPTEGAVGEASISQAAIVQDLESQNLVRRTSEGLDESGRRYLSGEVRVCMEDGQQAETVVIGFVPAFEGEPEVDMECEQEGVSTRIIHCTPAGMRVTVRRPQAKAALTFEFQWYAVQAESNGKATDPFRQLLP